MRLLVTGGYGFIGSNLVKELHNQNHTVDIVDNMSNGHKEFLEDIETRASFAGLIVEEDDRSFVRHYNCDFSNQ